MLTKIQRYEVTAETSNDYDGEYIYSYVDYQEYEHGDWVRWEDVNALLSRIKELEAKLDG